MPGRLGRACLSTSLGVFFGQPVAAQRRKRHLQVQGVSAVTAALPGAALVQSDRGLLAAEPQRVLRTRFAPIEASARGLGDCLGPPGPQPRPGTLGRGGGVSVPEGEPVLVLEEAQLGLAALQEPLGGGPRAEPAQEQLGALPAEAEQLLGNVLELLAKPLVGALVLEVLGLGLVLEQEKLFAEQLGPVLEGPDFLVLLPGVGFEALLLDFEEGELAPRCLRLRAPGAHLQLRLELALLRAEALERALELRVGGLESADFGAEALLFAGELGGDLVELVEELVFVRELFFERLVRLTRSWSVLWASWSRLRSSVAWSCWHWAQVGIYGSTASKANSNATLADLSLAARRC